VVVMVVVVQCCVAGLLPLVLLLVMSMRRDLQVVFRGGIHRAMGDHRGFGMLEGRGCQRRSRVVWHRYGILMRPVALVLQLPLHSGVVVP
jgi:hypothetical protein